MTKASADLLRDLASPDPGVRFKASKRLESELRKSRSRLQKTQFGNKKTTSTLLPLLDDPDPKIVHNTVVALAQIARNYFKDDRTYPKMLKLVRSKHPWTQRWAICALIGLRGESSLDDVLPLCKDRSAEAREQTLYHLFRWLFEMRSDRSGSIQQETQERLRVVALRSLNDAKSAVRAMAATLLSEVGDPAALAALRARLKKERNRDTKQCVNEAIEWLEGRV